ncbi:MAG TPA: transketolase [Armatimonadota bacterium]|nr:transketolase [Armatimonadota bacterium]
MNTTDPKLDERCINTIRFLAVDAVEKVKSGHPGTPMGAAAFVYTLWDRYLKFNPRNPNWPNRDRFILSAGHASMLLYALLYLTGYDLTLDDIKQFRQWNSKTPGHPEAERTPGVEVTTGPLGQGFGDSVGMAIAEHWLACRFNRPDINIIDHYTYVVASDGDMEEGVSSEAASLAGALRLGKLIVFYDDNNISIEGDTNIAFRENVGARFQAYGWQVLGPINGNDISAVDAVIKEARADTDRPTLIICQTVIGYGSPEQATGKVHGEPLGAENVKAAKDTLGWPQEPTFYVPDDVLSYMRKHIDTGKQAEEDWNKGLATYTQKFPDLATQLQLCLERKLPDGWDEGLNGLFPPDTKPIATRNASGKVLNVLAKHIPELLGGAADLAPSTKTLIEDGGNFEPQSYCGRNMHYGVREHAMGAVSNGLIRHGGIIPYTGTFLIFSDYMRPPMRLAALMGVRPIYVFTHDSIGLGEDGPTHQPVEQLMNLRTIPNFTLIRPADATETAEAWRAALQHTGGPVALVFTRQKLPVIDRTKYASAAGLHKGGYILWQSSDSQPDIILMATGSEVFITLQAGETLAKQHVNVRVVSMPCWKLFDQQPQDYRESVLPNTVRKRISVEAGAKIGWEHYVGLDGKIIGLDHFGASAPGETVMEKYGFTTQHIVEVAQELLG